MAQLTVIKAALAGVASNLVAADAGGDTFVNDGKTHLQVSNGGGSSINVTISSQYPTPPTGTAQSDQVIAVPAGEDRLIGPFNQKAFNDSNGEVNVAYSAVTSVTVQAVSVAG